MPREQMEFPLRNLPRLTHFGYSDQGKDSFFGPHKHYGYELIYVVRGETEVRMFEGSDPIILKRDDLYVIAPKKLHQFKYNRGNINFFWLGFQMEEDVILAENHMISPYRLLNRDKRSNPERVALIRQMDREITSLRDRIKIDVFRQFRRVPLFNRLFEDLEFELHHMDDFSEIIIYQKLIEIFAFIARLSSSPQKGACNPLNYAYRFLKNHNREKINFGELALKAGYSQEYFSRAFKLRFGISPRAFHEECRMSEARNFLSRDFSVQETASACGFKSSSHFSSWFKQREGLSPEKYYPN
ncbi:MAG: hypothetical protein B6241_14890 [Spirochaetaceae bacterium 4572_59]|nr:MAG: hypothetical protein B6241_14890 [Spirochaetaceae bacterium 4572_59]